MDRIPAGQPLSLEFLIMSAPATRRKRIAQLEISLPEPRFVQSNPGTSGMELSSSSRQQIPLGILHVNQDWKILEYRDRYEEYRDRFEDDDLPPVSALGKNLFAIAPWIGDPDFLETFDATVQSGIANSHFDFKVRLSTRSAERAIHINVFVLGDTTAWLFISDQSLPI